MSISKIFKYIKSSTVCKLWLALFVVSLVLACAFGIMRASGIEKPVEKLQPDGLETSVLQAEKNYVNAAQGPDSSFIYDVAIEELSMADSYLSGQTVQVKGEVVGDRILAEGDPEHCWITLQSTDKGDSEVIVYMTTKNSEVIDTYGAYGRRGTILQVRGVFNLACSDHQGASEMHAENVVAMEKGSTEKATLELSKLIPGLFLIMIGSALMLLFNVLRERGR